MFYKVQSSVSRNEILIEQSHSHFFMCYLYLLLSHMGRQKAERCHSYKYIMVCKAKYSYYLAPYGSIDPCSRSRTQVPSYRILGIVVSLHKIPDFLRKGYRLG